MKQILFHTLLACAFVFGLTNCTKGGGSSSGGTTTTVTTSSVCSAGSVYTSQYGCLPTANCAQYGANYGWNSGTNQCIQGTTNTTTACGTNMVYSEQYGCLSQCGTNAGWLNGQCVTLTSTTMTCATGLTYNAYFNACLQSCGTNAVIYNGQCIYMGTSGSYPYYPHHRRYSSYPMSGGFSFGFGF